MAVSTAPASPQVLPLSAAGPFSTAVMWQGASCPCGHVSSLPSICADRAPLMPSCSLENASGRCCRLFSDLSIFCLPCTLCLWRGRDARSHPGQLAKASRTPESSRGVGTLGRALICRADCSLVGRLLLGLCVHLITFPLSCASQS